MIQTRIQEWLVSVFSAFDYNILSFLHYFAEKTHGALTDIFKIIGILSENGILLLISGIILFCIRRTRKLGFCLSGAVCCSAFITLFLKDFIARPRPFVDTTSMYHDWWQFIALPAESGFAFPSGHTTVAMAAAVALFLNVNKKISWISFIFVIITGISRCYLMVHYPSDILGGIFFGTLGALLAYLISPIFFTLWNKFLPARLSNQKI
jgi:undecaprenyl-diphosphatase